MADNDIMRIKRPVEMRPIPGFEGRYSITRGGRVWSHNSRSRRWLKPWLDKKGYHIVSLWHDNQKTNFFIHYLVMLTWGPAKPSPNHEINHCDTNKLNNHVLNLEWLTHLQNIRHGLSLGRRSRGEFTAKLSETEVLEIRQRYANGELQETLATAFGVRQPAISRIVNRRRRQYI